MVFDDFLGVFEDKINDDWFYCVFDIFLLYKDVLCRYFQKCYGEFFGVIFDFFFYDIILIYFEGIMYGNVQVKWGYSRDSCFDCFQVCIGFVVMKEGLLIVFEIFDGNCFDVMITWEMVGFMERKYGKVNWVWVFDWGMVSEDNLGFMCFLGVRYLVGMFKLLLKKFEWEFLEYFWEEVVFGVEVVFI